MLIIRPAKAQDIPAITAIYAQAVETGTASWELTPPAVADMLARFEAVAAGGYPYLLAETAERVLGYAYASAYRPREAYRHTVENSIYVAPEAQGRGVGRRLLATLIDECVRRGFRQMMAVIGDSDNAASRRLHEAHGFELVGIARSLGFKHGRWLDQVLMRRALGAGDSSPP